MSRKKIDFKVEEVYDEVVDMFNFIGSSLDDILTHSGGNEVDFYLIALGIDRKDMDWNLCTNKPGFNREKFVQNFFSLKFDLDNTYEYANDGTIPNYNDTIDCLSGMDMICYEGLLLFEHWFKRHPDSKLDFLYQLAYARKNLDEDEDFPIKRLALLAGVDERTIRNLASAGAFEIKKSGSSTVIANAEARKWLNTRPDFKPTKYQTEPDGHVASSVTEFGQFMAQKRQEQELTLDDVSKAIGIDSAILADLEKGIDRVQLSQITKLQNLFKIENNKLFIDYMKTFHYEEFSNLTQIFQENTSSSKPKSDVTDHKLKLVS
jgi:transcriptional regulator with XRE-family HTH domain